MTQPIDGDFTELADARIDRVDLVGAPANGRPFVLMKAAADGGLTQPLIPREMVADLIAKADHLETAVTDPAPIVKADLDVTDAPAADDLIPTAPAGSTASSLPGSPDWEQLDGDTAMNAVAVLGRLKGVLGWLADREAQEAVTGDGDGSAVWNLDDMACTLDAMIGALAGFAVGEHMEATELEQVGKAVAQAAEALPVVEGLAPLAKAGRTLSAANEAKIRAAVDSLTGVLNSLPQAPAADVTKTEEPAVAALPPLAVEITPALPDHLAKMLDGAPQLTAADLFTALTTGGRALAKAAGDPQLAVFDADGKLIGTIDPGKLSPIATSPAAADKADEPPADEPADDEAPADAAAEPAAAADPADGAVIPGTATVQAPAPAAAPEDDTQTPAVAKTAAATLEELRAEIAEDVRKAVASEVEELREQVRKMGQQPDNRRSPILNGATGQPGAIARDGQDGDQFADLRKAVDSAATADERTKASSALAYAQIRARFTN